MFNWHEIEELARIRYELNHEALTGPQRLKQQALEEMEALRRPLRSRLAEALVRLSARLDPKTVVITETAAGDHLVEGRLAAYLR